MLHKKLKLNVILLLGLGLTGLQAQEAIPIAGGNASGSEGSASYTVGQVIFTTYTGINGSVSQGVQQPFEISVVTGLEDVKGIILYALVYPNPTNDFLTLSIENLEVSNLSYQLLNMSGKLLEAKKIEGNHTIISLSKLVPSTYFLKIMENNKEVKTFKIINY